MKSSCLAVRLSIWLELIIFFSVALALDALINSPSIRYSDVSPHPFWIPVLLCSVHYGTREGWLATVMATLVLLVGNIPIMSFGQDYYDYLFSISKNPLLWLIASTVLGELTLHKKAENSALGALVDSLQQASCRLTETNANLAAEYSRASQTLVDRTKSPIALLQSIPTLFGLSITEVLQGLDNSVKNLFDPESFAVFRFSREALVPLHLDETGRRLSALMETTQGLELRKILSTRRQLLSIANPSHQSLLKGIGLFAAPLWDEHGGKVYGILLINNMRFEEVNSLTLAELALLCECANKSLSFTAHHERQLAAKNEVNRVSEWHSQIDGKRVITGGHTRAVPSKRLLQN